MYGLPCAQRPGIRNSLGGGPDPRFRWRSTRKGLSMKTPARVTALVVTGVVAGLAAYGLPGAAAAAAAPPPITLYAAPAGSGSACTVARPCDLAGAAAKVRTIDRDMKSDIDVDLYGGDYRLASTLRLGPQDSGTNGFQVVYQPVRGQ